MLAAHQDQENRVFAHQAGAVTKQQNLQQQKTPGARFPKTPLKVPLNDENAATQVLGGKTILGGRGGNENIRTISKGGKTGDKGGFVTPGEPRTARAPLGNKTTNAKARTTQQLTVKDIAKEFEKTAAKPTTARRPKIRSPQADTFKLEVHNEKSEEQDDGGIEYAPPRPEEQPYQSDVFPAGAFNFDAFKPENRMKGFHQYYHNPVDDNGETLRERQMREEREKVFKQLEEDVQKDLDEWDWSVGDVPESKDFFKKRQAAKAQTTTITPSATGTKAAARKPPPTIASRKAASALSMPTQTNAPKASQPKAVKKANAKTTSSLFHPLMKKTAPPTTATSGLQPKDTAVAAAATRTTLGYNKGRSTSSMIHSRGAQPPTTTTRKLARTASTASSGSDTTITPARFAQQQVKREDTGYERLELLSIFDAGEDEDGGFGITDDVIHEDEDETFQFTIPDEN